MLQHRTFRLIFAGLLLLAFAVLSKYEDRVILRSIDFTVTVKVQDFVSTYCATRCDGLLEDIGFFAGPLFSVFVITVITTITFIRKKGWKKLLALGIPLLFVLLTLVEIYGKTMVRHPAPPFFLLKNPTTIFPTYYVWQEFSYPSGHAARVMFLALVLFSAIQQFNNRTMRKRLWLGLGLGIYVGLISLTRIYLGHHWISDVVGGWLIGGAFGVLTYGVLRPYNRTHNE